MLPKKYGSAKCTVEATAMVNTLQPMVNKLSVQCDTVLGMQANKEQTARKHAEAAEKASVKTTPQKKGGATGGKANK